MDLGIYNIFIFLKIQIHSLTIYIGILNLALIPDVTNRFLTDHFFPKIPIYRKSDWFALVSCKKDRDIKYVRDQKISHNGMDKI